MLTAALSTLMVLAAPARAAGVPQPPPAAARSDRAEQARRVAAYRRARQDEREAFRLKLRGEEEALRAKLAGSRSAEATAARAALKAREKRERADFEAEQKAKRAAFLKDNPDIAARWEKERRRREEAKARCAKDPECRPKAGK